MTFDEPFIPSQLNYCVTDKKNNSLYKRCLQIKCDGMQESLKQLLQKFESSSFNNRNLQALATEIYKVSKDLLITANHD